MIAESLDIPKTVVLWILKEDLGKRKLCARFVPHSMTPEQRDYQVTSCQNIITMTNANKNFFNKIITGDETWCFACDPETKRHSSEWVGETSPWLKKLKSQKSHIKTMLIIFFNLYKREKRVNAEFYKEVMERLLKHTQRVRPAVFCSQDCFCPQYVCQFFTQKMLQPRTLQIYLRQTIFCSPS
jgi:hypothetical protein